MNLSFSTRGWNHLSWDEQVRDAEEMGFQGIEPYNIQEYPSLSGRGGAFHAYMQNETIRTLRKSGLVIPCFDTYIDLSIQQESLEKAIARDIVQCYAIEGQYPPTLQYMEEHYGLTYDKDTFFVDYQPIAANLYPDYTVILR